MAHLNLMKNINLKDKKEFFRMINYLFSQKGKEQYAGEEITVSDHMLQSATHAVNNGLSDEIIIASLFHDVGHLLLDQDIYSNYNDHEKIGAEFIKDFFSDKIFNCVRMHVDAKRYLCTKDSSYFAKLSSASVASFKVQGGEMNKEEIKSFEKNQFFNEILLVRELDEKAKDTNFKNLELEFFITKIESIFLS